MYLGRVILGILTLVLMVSVSIAAGFLWLVPIWAILNVIMALDMVILFNKRKAAIETASTRVCPFCAERVRLEATVCRYCQQKLTSPEPVVE